MFPGSREPDERRYSRWALYCGWSGLSNRTSHERMLHTLAVLGESGPRRVAPWRAKSDTLLSRHGMIGESRWECKNRRRCGILVRGGARDSHTASSSGWALLAVTEIHQRAQDALLGAMGLLRLVAPLGGRGSTGITHQARSCLREILAACSTCYPHKRSSTAIAQNTARCPHRSKTYWPPTSQMSYDRMSVCVG